MNYPYARKDETSDTLHGVVVEVSAAGRAGSDRAELELIRLALDGLVLVLRIPTGQHHLPLFSYTRLKYCVL